MIMRQHYSTLERHNDPLPETDRPFSITRQTVEKRMNGDECQRLLHSFMHRADPTYSRTDAEIDYLSDPIAAWTIAKRELFLQSNP